MERCRVCVQVRKCVCTQVKEDRENDAGSNVLSVVCTSPVLCSFLFLCPRGESYRLAGWAVLFLYMPRPMVWLNCHCFKVCDVCVCGRGGQKDKKGKDSVEGGKGWMLRERERNEWPCRLPTDSEIFLLSSSHHASCVCLMGREWQPSPPPHLSL